MPPPRGRRSVNFADGFRKEYQALLATRPAIKDKLETVIEFKTENPPRNLPAGMNDHTLNDRLAGYRDCHLAGDIVLVYKITANSLELLKICGHDEMKGPREKALAKELRGLEKLPKRK